MFCCGQESASILSLTWRLYSSWRKLEVKHKTHGVFPASEAMDATLFSGIVLSSQLVLSGSMLRILTSGCQTNFQMIKVRIHFSLMTKHKEVSTREVCWTGLMIQPLHTDYSIHSSRTLRTIAFCWMKWHYDDSFNFMNVCFTSTYVHHTAQVAVLTPATWESSPANLECKHHLL